MSTHSNPTTSPRISEAILNYIAAANDGRIDDAAACFTTDARVHDENHDYQGIEAIREWIAETTESSQPKNEVLTADADGEAYAITSRISGNFPGSPVELDFHFIVTNGKISNLRIQ